MNGRIPRDYWKSRGGASLFNGPVLRTAGENLGQIEAGRPASELSSSGLASGLRFPKSIGADPARVEAPKYYRSMYVPASYEARYPYPLVVWFHGRGGSEHDLLDVMPAISAQNYLGLAVRGPVSSKAGSSGFGWDAPEVACARYEAIISTAVRQFRAEYHIHSERIYLAGIDEGAQMALRLLLARPEWFGGAALFGIRFTPIKGQLVHFGELRGKPVLLGAGARDSSAPVTETIKLSRLLHAAGLDVTTRVFNAAHETTPEMLKHVDTWLMEGIAAANCSR